MEDTDDGDEVLIEDFGVGGTPFEELDDFDVAPPRMILRQTGEWSDDDMLTLQAMAQETFDIRGCA